MLPYTAPLLGLFFNRCSGKNVHCTWTLYVDSVRGQWNQHAYTPARLHATTGLPPTLQKFCGKRSLPLLGLLLNRIDQSDRSIG